MHSGPKSALVIAAGFVMVLLSLSPVLSAGYTEVFHSGKIDWSRWSAEAVGTTVLSARNIHSEKAKAAAAEDAVKSARANLFDLVGRIKVHSSTTVKDLMLQSDQLRNRMKDLVEKVPPRRVRFGKGGRVEATVSMSMTGAFSELVLPDSIRAIDSVQQSASTRNSQKETFTGLVVECTGIRISPAMFLSIIDEDGQLVYGSPYIHRDHAVKRGIAVYSRDAAAAQKDERVAPRPLVVRGIRAAPTGASDIVISNSDAGRVRGSAYHLKWLQSCRMIVVLE